MAAASMDGDFLGDDISSKGKHYPMVVLTNKKLLLDDQFADITIYVNSDKVSAHSAILACRCEELVPMPNESDKKKKVKPKKDVKVKGIANEQIMRRVLEFLYTGRVEFPKLPTLEILQLNAAARHFKLNRLGYLCERWLREHMCMDNVFHLLKGSVDAGETRVKAFCLQYALDHYTEFIANKDGIHILGIDLFQEVVKAFTDRPPAPEEIPPDKAPPDTLIEDFQRLFERMPYSDVVFNVGGTQIKCHKAILAAHSDSFVPHIANAPATGVDFNALSPAAFQSMLKFLYYGDDNIDPHPATELVGFSKQYKLHSLLGICEDKCRTSVSTETVLDILATTYIPEMEEKPELVEELKRKTFPFILANLTEIDLTPIRKLHPNIAIDILLQIQKSWGESVPAYDGGGNDYSTSTSTSTSTSFTSTSTSTSATGGSFALGSQRAAAPPPPVRGSTGGDDERPPPPPPRTAPPSVGAPPTPVFPPPVTTSSSTDDARPPPPPPRDASANGLQAPPPLSSSTGSGPAPPPRIGDPPPPIGIPSGTPPPPPPIGDGSETPKKGGGDKTPKKSTSSGGIKKDGAKKKEDEKKKKEEEKRIAKEKKEREKMEKKVKGSKGATKAPPS